MNSQENFLQSPTLQQQVAYERPQKGINIVVIGVFFLFSSLIFGVVGFYLGQQSVVAQLAKYANEDAQDQQLVVLPTTLEPTDKTELTLNQLPAGWVYKDSGKCEVQFGLPPKEAPYYHPADESIPFVSVDQLQGRYWDFPRGGAYPHMLSKFPGFDESNLEMQAITMYASDIEASGYVSQAVAVSCMPNNGQYVSTSELLPILSSQLESYNSLKREDSGQQASNYTITSSIPTQRWNQNVIDLVVQEDTRQANYTIFVTPSYIYEVKVFGESKDDFVKETAQKIFENLVFEVK